MTAKKYRVGKNKKKRNASALIAYDKTNARLSAKEKFVQRIERLLKRITYRPEISLSFHSNYYLWEFDKNVEPKGYIKIQSKTLDVENNYRERLLVGRSVNVEASESEEEVIFKIWKMIKDFEDHERDEFFQVDGVRVYNPHHPISQRVA